MKRRISNLLILSLVLGALVAGVWQEDLTGRRFSRKGADRELITE